MTEGLITRIGRWIDNKWESKATERALEQLKFDLTQAIRITNEQNEKEIGDLNKLVLKVEALQIDSISVKEIADLKTRMEKIEVYSGMARKVDPTKPLVVKSAFQM